jgi:hypothetical protein
VRAALASCIAAVVAAAIVSPAQAQVLRVERQRCDKRVRVVAHNVQAGAVMATLAQTLGFRISSETALDSVVNFDSAVPIADVVSAVLPRQNVIISERKDPNCPGQYQISRVWLLARAGEPAAPAKPDLSSVLSAYAAVPVTKESQENDDLYKRAHGLLPPLDAAQPP